MGKLWVGIGAYYAAAAVFVVSGRGSAILLAVGAAALLTAGLVSTATVLWRQDGVERQILLEAASIAFLVTVVVAGVASAFGDRLPLSPLWLYDIGVVAWLATTVVRTRQLT